jgi:hypothetical protein
MKINVHAGHSLVCRGATAFLDEVNEDRKVKTKVINMLRAEGHTVYDCTDDDSRTQTENLYNIVKKCNSHAVNLDISIHLNAGRNDYTGDGKTGGVEVYGYNNEVREIGERICRNVSKDLKITNRGFKINTSLYVLRKTKARALLIECCFVDDKDDAAHWNADQCAVAIVEGILNRSLAAGSSSSAQTYYYPKYTGTTVSIVTALQDLKIDSSYSTRAKIAAKNGITGYKGTADQNTKMLSLLKQGKLIRL